MLNVQDKRLYNLEQTNLHKIKDFIILNNVNCTILKFYNLEQCKLFIIKDYIILNNVNCPRLNII